MLCRMDRLTLLPRKTLEKEKCLPAGDGLPLWSRLPLYSKFPMVPNPKGSIVFCTTPLCDPIHMSSRNFEFDLTDPNCHVVSNEYHPLHDRHLSNYFNLPHMRRHLIKKGFITHDGRVICNLKEFNSYRQYLRKICLMELERENKLLEEERNLCVQAGAEKVKTRPMDNRIKIVRQRLTQKRETTRQRIEQFQQQKADRIQKRLDETNTANMEREVKRQERERKRQTALQQQYDELQKRNHKILRTWKNRDRQNIKRQEEKRRRHDLEQQQKSLETWETRKQLQRITIEHEEMFLQQEQRTREKNITARDTSIKEQREKFKAKLEQLKQKSRREREERERKHARRLAHRLALTDVRALSKQRGKSSRNARFRSLWTLEETLRHLEIPDYDYEKSSKYLDILNDAMNEGDYDEEPDDQEKAKIIVNYVFENVKNYMWSRHTETVEDNFSEEYFDTGIKTVKFGDKDIHCTSNAGSVDLQTLRPVKDHVLTPVASSLDVSDIPTEDKMLVEKLLHRLLDDLNQGKISREDLVELTSLSMEIISSMQTTESDELAGLESGDLYETAVAKDLVRFTLGKILNDIKSGEIDQTELTNFTVSVLEAQKEPRDRSDEESIDSNDEEISLLIEETLQHIMVDKSVEESPICDDMLDEFIISTLAEISDDLEHNRLSTNFVSQMLSMISDEVVTINDGKDSNFKVRNVLEKIMKDLEIDGNDTLYKVAHVIIAFYQNYKDAYAQSLSELITIIVGKISNSKAIGQLQESEFDLDKLYFVATSVSSASFTSEQMHRIASQLAFALRLEQDQNKHETKCFVEQIVHDVKEKLIVADEDQLKNLASAIMSSWYEFFEERGSTIGEQTTIEISQHFLSDVIHFVTDVLKRVLNSLDKGHFSDVDIKHMSQFFQKVGLKSSQMTTSNEERKHMLILTVKELLNEVENNRIEKAELYGLGEQLLNRGKKILGLYPPCSTSSSKTSSFTSTAVAEDVVSHILSSVHRDLVKTTISIESLKELAVCIFKYRTQHSDYKRDSELLHASPSESELAEYIVTSTIDDILKDLHEGTIIPETLSSIAVSAVSSISLNIGVWNKIRMKSAMKNISEDLRRDSIDKNKAKKMFDAILDSYEKEWKVTFTSTDVPLTSDSQLAETLIRETLSKINRDLQSGEISTIDLLTISDNIQEEETKQCSGASEDVVNLSLAIVQEMLTGINMETIPIETAKDFVALCDSSISDTGTLSVETLNRRLRIVQMEMIRHRAKSIYVSRIIQSFEAENRKDTNEGEPLEILQKVLQIMKSDTLTHFVRVTLLTLLTGMQHKPRDNEKRQSGSVVTDTALHSVASVIANNVVRSVLLKVETALLHGGSQISEEELLTIKLKSVEGQQQIKTIMDEAGITSAHMYSSKGLENLVLDTLNNIVSNIRLEYNILPCETDRSHEGLRDCVSSNFIQDFVLEKLQIILEMMQDRIQFGSTYSSDVIPILKDKKEMDKKLSSIMLMDDRQVASYMTTILRDVVAEKLADVNEVAKQIESQVLDKQVSKFTLKAETAVLSTLQDIIRDFTATEDLEQNKKGLEESKKKVLVVLEEIKKEIVSDKKNKIKEAVTDLVRSFHPSGDISIDDPSLTEDNDLIETIDSIINSVENDKIKILYTLDSSISELFVNIKEEDATTGENVMQSKNRQALNLQKMLDMTSKMLKIYDEARRESRLLLQDQLNGFTMISNVSESVVNIVKETISKTIESVKGGKLSDEEIVSLASSLSHSRLNSEVTHRLSTTSTDDSIENFIAGVLECMKQDIQTVGLNSQSLHSITDRLVELGKKCETVSSKSSELSMEMVKGVLMKISKTFIDECKDKGNEQVRRDRSESSGSGRLSRENVNPNAAIKKYSAKSYPTPSSYFAPNAVAVNQSMKPIVNIPDVSLNDAAKRSAVTENFNRQSRSPTSCRGKRIDRQRSNNHPRSELSFQASITPTKLNQRSRLHQQQLKFPCLKQHQHAEIVVTKKPVIICADSNTPTDISFEQLKTTQTEKRRNTQPDLVKSGTKNASRRCPSAISPKNKLSSPSTKLASPRKPQKSKRKIDGVNSSALPTVETATDSPSKNSVNYSHNDSKKVTVPMVVASLCGSHRTKVHTRVTMASDN